MEIIDYNKNVSTLKEKLNEDREEIRKNFNRRLKNQNEKSNHLNHQQKNSYDSKISKLNEEVSKNIIEKNHKIQTGLQKLKDKFNSRNEESQKNYMSDLTKKKSEFNERLDGIKKSYDHSLEDDRNINKRQESNLKKLTKKNKEIMAKEFDSSAKALKGKNNDSLIKMKEINREEVLDLKKNNEDKLRKVRQSAIDKSSSEKNFNRKVRDEISHSNKQQFDNLIKNREETIESIKSVSNRERKDNLESFQGLNERTQRKSDLERTENFRSKVDQLNAKDKYYLGEINRIKGARNPNRLNEEKLKDFIQDQENKFESKLNRSKSIIEENFYDKKNSEKKLLSGQKEALGKTRAKFKAALSSKEEQLSNENIQEIDRVKIKKDGIIGRYRERLRTTLIENQQRLDSEKAINKKSLNEERSKFNETLKDISGHSESTILKQEKDFAAEKADLISTFRKNALEEQNMMRDAMNEDFQIKTDGLYRQLENKDKSKEKMEKRYQDRISSLHEKMSKELNRSKEFELEQIKRLKEDNRKSLLDKGREYKKQFQIFKDKSERKIVEIESRNQKALEKLNIKNQAEMDELRRKLRNKKV